jgi:hypothetical protein
VIGLRTCSHERGAKVPASSPVLWFLLPFRTSVYILAVVTVEMFERAINRAALSTGGRAKGEFLSVFVVPIAVQAKNIHPQFRSTP